MTLATMTATQQAEELLDRLEAGDPVGTVETVRVIRALLAERNGGLSDEALQRAMSCLSYSEEIVMYHLMVELNGPEGLVVASQVADKHSLTRSVIVTALRKLESGGVLRSQSLGQKGTHIRMEPSAYKAFMAHLAAKVA